MLLLEFPNSWNSWNSGNDSDREFRNSGFENFKHFFCSSIVHFFPSRVASPLLHLTGSRKGTREKRRATLILPPESCNSHCINAPKSFAVSTRATNL